MERNFLTKQFAYKLNEKEDNINYIDDNTDIVIEMINNSLIEWANGFYTFCDADKIIYVDTENGLCGCIDKAPDGSDIYTRYATGDTSCKANGYVYIPIDYYNNYGYIDMFPFAQHKLILILTDKEGYYDIKERGYKKPECCHKRGCPWDNRAANLEWGTRGENSRQGKITVSLDYHFPDKYTHIEHNMSKKKFVVLNQPILNDYVNKYIDYKGYNQFRLNRQDEYINSEVLIEFIEWLYTNGYWK